MLFVQIRGVPSCVFAGRCAPAHPNVTTCQKLPLGGTQVRACQAGSYRFPLVLFIRYLAFVPLCMNGVACLLFFEAHVVIYSVADRYPLSMVW